MIAPTLEGMVWEGVSAYFDVDEAAIQGIAPGHWAIDKDGSPKHRLVAIDDAPGDEECGDWHLEVAAQGDPIARPGKIVALEVVAEGHSAVSG